MSDDAASPSMAVYMRVSSDEQKRAGTIETQRSVLDRYVTLNALTPYGWYEDEAWSGYAVPFALRPAGARLMADIQAGHVKTVLVRKLDRFGRNAREILNAVHVLEEAGARLISLKENIDTSTSAGRFFLTVLAGVAELEREMIIERSTEGRERRLESTAWMGGHAQIGYRVEGKKRDARLVLDDDPPDESGGYSGVDIVRLCWHLLVEQAWSCERIALRLEELGIPTYRRRRDGMQSHWAPATVYRMLRDATYVGMRTHVRADGTSVSHPVPAILTQEQYDRAQAALADHKRHGGRVYEPNDTYLLRDVLRCGECGARYTTGSTIREHGPYKGKQFRFYACSTRRRHHRDKKRQQAQAVIIPAELAPPPLPTCIGVGLDAAWIEAKVWTEIEGYIRNPGTALTVLAAQYRESHADANAHRAALARIQQALDAQQAERDSILTLYRRGRISERDLDRQLDTIAAEEAKHLKKRDHLMKALSDATEAAERLENARTLLQQLHIQLDHADASTITPAFKRKAIMTLVREIRVDAVEDVGLSQRGRVKRHAEIHAYYQFDDPAKQYQSCLTLHATVQRRWQT